MKYPDSKKYGFKVGDPVVAIVKRGYSHQSRYITGTFLRYSESGNVQILTKCDYQKNKTRISTCYNNYCFPAPKEEQHANL